MKFALHRLEASHCQWEMGPKPRELSAAGIVGTSGEVERLGVQAPETFAMQSEKGCSPDV